MSGLVSLRPEKIIFSAKYAYVAYRVTQNHKMESGIRLILGFLNPTKWNFGVLLWACSVHIFWMGSGIPPISLFKQMYYLAHQLF